METKTITLTQEQYDALMFALNEHAYHLMCAQGEDYGKRFPITTAEQERKYMNAYSETCKLIKLLEIL